MGEVLNLDPELIKKVTQHKSFPLPLYNFFVVDINQKYRKLVHFYTSPSNESATHWSEECDTLATRGVFYGG